MTHRLFTAALLTFLVQFVQYADAQVYKWVDDEGGVHYTDQTQVLSEEANAIDLSNINTYAAPEILESTYRGSNVIMYSAAWCAVCKKAERYFRRKGIPFIEYDIEKNDQARREYRKLGARGVPVILVGSKRLNGFTEEAFDALYYR